MGTADDLFGPTGETVAQIRDRVLPVGATINGVTVVDDATRVPLYTETPGFVVVNLRSGLAITRHLNVTLALINALDCNYRVHGSGVDAPGRAPLQASRCRSDRSLRVAALKQVSFVRRVRLLPDLPGPA
jgi:hypothetical protein